MESRDLARYPFMPAASAFAAERGPSLEDILLDPVYATLRRQGRDRLMQAVEDGELPLIDSPTDETELLFDLLTYPVARMLTSASEDSYVTRRHALAESVRVRGFLDREADPRVVVEVARELGLPAEAEEGDDGLTGAFLLHFTHYVRLASVLKDTPWKLVNQPLKGGVVTLERVKLARLCQEALRRRLEAVPEASAEVKKALNTECRAILDAARVKREAFEAHAFGPVDLESFPPCMRQILGMLQSGENAPHSARFAITSFLNTIGLDSEEIMTLFSQAPDFREDLTRYQVEHITGKTSGTTYSPPSCQAMGTFGICYNPDKWCTMTNKEGERYVTHPLSYYRWAVKRKAQDEARRGLVPVSSPPVPVPVDSGNADAEGAASDGASSARDP